MFGGLFENKKVWLSGHTGFKGSWLATWLLELGARVHGFALEPSTKPSLFEQLGLSSQLHQHEIGDIRDLAAVEKSIRDAAPDFVFHLAAQPIVRFSYQEPVETYQTNVMGTVHVLEVLRSYQQPCAAVFVTTDKCYVNQERHYAYREEDPLGGHDPYSSSKAAAEIAIAAYRSSYFSSSNTGILPVGRTGFQPVPQPALAGETPAIPTGKMPVPLVKIASARAGNVIGGGDWASDRIVPDAIRSLGRSEAVGVRNKKATRPWQHVLEPLSGYLWLAAVLAQPSLRERTSPAEFAGAFNFGPEMESARTVEELMEQVLKHAPGKWVDRPESGAVHEAGLLNLAIDKAHHLLGWQPVWTFEENVAETVRWYNAVAKGGDAPAFTRDQIQAYSTKARTLGMAWASHPG
jgi:CDP-glucose 4,6-dehydratase